MDINKLNEQIAAEIETERTQAELADFKPPSVSRAQVSGAKYAWMFIAFSIDAATAYALYIILAPYWYYAAFWVVVGVGGLVFSEWLWERVGNNDKQSKISSTSKNVSALSILVMALVTGVALVVGIERTMWIEAVAVLSVVSLAFFHGWQAYRYHEVDDDYIANTIEAKKEAQNLKEIREIHRAGRRIDAKKRVYLTGQQYQNQHGEAFVKETGRSFVPNGAKPEPANPTKGQEK